MRHFFLFSFFLLSFQFLKAQDTITKRNGEKLVVKLVEVNPDNVRYRRFDYQDGPVFTLSKQEIKILVYANGKSESFENYVAPVVNAAALPPIDLTMQSTGNKYYYKERRIAEPDMLAIASKQNDKKINLMIKRTENLKFIQKTAGTVSIPVFVYGLILYAANGPRRSRRGSPPPSSTAASAQARMNGEYIMLGGITCELVCIAFKFDRSKHAHMVVDAYNKLIAQSK